MFALSSDFKHCQNARWRKFILIGQYERTLKRSRQQTELKPEGGEEEKGDLVRSSG